ncbi:hypothetical protein [Halobacillus campisalis]|uniref:hypothetical protein n=1 Tax=Halobacillus campisalis TaxID=435909 RepID=UPI0036F41120
MSNPIYSDNRKMLRKLLDDGRYEATAEVYREGILIAALFQRVERGDSFVNR